MSISAQDLAELAGVEQGQDLPALDVVERKLESLKQDRERLGAVNLRADRDTMYEWVEPAMRAATTGARLAGGGALPRLDLVVEVGHGP